QMPLQRINQRFPSGLRPAQQEVTMCYEFWQHQDKQQQKDDIAKRVQDMIEKAKTAPPAPKPTRRPATATEQDIVPV
ncbi:MAG: hypothetical protein KKA36_07165, partial [Gammaproteobacteria bacterium]|nr:hypothetical protein [Gammaproteobacteria bacterium]